MTLSIRLPKKLHAAMKRLAKQERRSLNFMIVQACEELIERRMAR